MSETELQELSRQAAGCLPEDFFEDSPRLCWTDTDGYPGKVMILLPSATHSHWLHESDAACTEIMVRVLWAAGSYVKPHNVSIEQSQNEVFAMHEGFDGVKHFSRVLAANLLYNDPLLAFRVAVLKALIALKGSK